MRVRVSLRRSRPSWGCLAARRLWPCLKATCYSACTRLACSLAFLPTLPLICCCPANRRRSRGGTFLCRLLRLLLPQLPRLLMERMGDEGRAALHPNRSLASPLLIGRRTHLWLPLIQAA